MRKIWLFLALVTFLGMSVTIESTSAQDCCKAPVPTDKGGK